MMTIKNITSIGWLNSADGSIRLTPCFDGNAMPFFVKISKEEFEKTKMEVKLMKDKVIEKINNLSI